MAVEAPTRLERSQVERLGAKCSRSPEWRRDRPSVAGAACCNAGTGRRATASAGGERFRPAHARQPGRILKRSSGPGRS